MKEVKSLGFQGLDDVVMISTLIEDEGIAE
jgi:hypothetical protein